MCLERRGDILIELDKNGGLSIACSASKKTECW